MHSQTFNFLFASFKRVNNLIDLLIANSDSIAYAVLTFFISFSDANCITAINKNFNSFYRGRGITHDFNSSNKDRNNFTCVLAIKTSAIDRLFRKEAV